MKYQDFLNELIDDTKNVKRKINAAAGVIMKVDENDRKQILLIQRSPDDHWPHHWEFPRGKCDRGPAEEVIPCAKREIKEETGLKVRVVALIDTFQYLADKGERLTTCYNYLCELVPEEQEVKLSNEHQDFKWISEIGEAEMLALPDQKKTIEKVLNGDRPMVNYTENDFTKNNQIEEREMTIDNLLKDFILEAEDVGTEQHLYEHIMVLVAEARWQRRLSQGLLKVADLRRIQKHKGGPDPLYVKQLMKQGKEKAANSYLKKKGLVKSARTWLAGVEKGTKNILKKYKAKVVHKPDAAFTNQAAAAGMADFAGLKKGQTMRNPMGAHAKVTKGGKRARVHVATGVKKKDQGMQTVFKRHEADEVRAAIKQTKMKKGKGVAVPLRQDAGHMSSEVLRKERELVRTAKALYGKKSGGKKIAKMRDATGEYDSIKGQTKKSIAKSDKAQRSEYIDAVRAQKKQIRAASPEERAEAIKDLRSQLKDVGLSNKDMKMVIQAIT